MGIKAQIDRLIGYLLDRELTVSEFLMGDIDRFSQGVENFDDFLVAEQCKLTAMLLDYPRELRLKREHVTINFKVNRDRHMTSP